MAGELLCEHLERARYEAGNAVGVGAGAAATDQPGEGVQAPGDCIPFTAPTLDTPIARASPIAGVPKRKLLEAGGDRIEAEQARPALAGTLRGEPAGEAGELRDGAGLLG